MFTPNNDCLKVVRVKVQGVIRLPRVAIVSQRLASLVCFSFMDTSTCVMNHTLHSITAQVYRYTMNGSNKELFLIVRPRSRLLAMWCNGEPRDNENTNTKPGIIFKF